MASHNWIMSSVQSIKLAVIPVSLRRATIRARRSKRNNQP
jgi:hypothetical protein